MLKKYHFTANVSDGKHRDGEVEGTVEAHGEAGARQAIAECVQRDGARKGCTWTAFNINLT